MNKPKRSVCLATVKRVYKGKTYVSHLLRHTYREDGRVKQLTLGSLTDLPDDLIELIRRRLTKGEPIGGSQGEEVAEEAALDGIYVVRTNVAAETMSAEQVVAGYKGLSHVERAFRSLKTTMLQLRPIYHWRDDRICAHVFLCMLSYYVEWHLRRDLRPLLFHDEERETAEKQRASIVRPAPRSDAAVRKERERRTADGLPVQSLRCLLGDLATICRNTVRWRGSSATFERMTVPTASQRRALEMLGVSLEAAK